MHTTVVGRDAECARLLTLVHAAAEGRGGSALVTGDAGIGKSTLVGALVAAAGDVTVAVGAGSPGGAAQLPFAPWIEILGTVETAAAELGVEVPAGVRRAVAPLVRPWDATSEPTGGPAAMFAAVIEFLVRTAAVRPLLVVVEDVHWADASSRDLLAHVVGRSHRARVAVVVTSRPAPTSSTGGVHELARAATTTVSLGPLPDRDIAAVLDLAAPAAPDGIHDRARIVRLADGNPFLALHLARRQTVAHDNDDADVLGVRRATTDRDAADLLLRLALGPDDLPDDVLAAATGLPVERRAAVTRSLVDDGFLVVAGGRLGFRHALLREEVSALATPAELTRAHADLADALTAGWNGAGAARVARHQLGCGRWAAALDSLLAAADHAERLHAYREAQDALVAARDVWPRAVPADAPPGETSRPGLSFGELLVRLGRTARTRGDFATAHTVWDDVARLPHDPAVLAHDLALTFFLEGDEATAVGHLERADTLLTPATPLSRGRVLADLAQALLTCHRGDDARRVADAAAEIAEDPWARLNARITRVVATYMTGASEPDVIAELRACTREARALGAVDLVLRSYGGLLSGTLACGRFDEVLRLVDEVNRICAAFGPVPTLISVVTPFHVEALRALGRWDEAVRVAGAGVGDATFRDVAAVLDGQLALVAADRGEWELVERHLRAAESGRVEDPMLIAMLFAIRVRRSVDRGGTPMELEQIRAAISGWPTRVLGDAALTLVRAAWQGLAAVGEVPAEFVTVLDALTDDHRVDDRAWWRVLRQLGRAERARALGEPDESEHWATVVDEIRGLGWRSELPRALGRHAEALARSRRLVEAGRRAHEAGLAADAVGATVVRAEVDRLLALLGNPPAPTDAHPPAHPLGLTPRELQVLGLLTNGASNREIGRTLFISERTAGVHVSNIIGKLGVRNRTQAAQIGGRWVSGP